MLRLLLHVLHVLLLSHAGLVGRVKRPRASVRVPATARVRVTVRSDVLTAAVGREVTGVRGVRTALHVVAHVAAALRLRLLLLLLIVLLDVAGVVEVMHCVGVLVAPQVLLRTLRKEEQRKDRKRRI